MMKKLQRILLVSLFLYFLGKYINIMIRTVNVRKFQALFFLISNKMLVSQMVVWNALIRLFLQKESDLGLHFLSRFFGRELNSSCKLLRTNFSQ